MNKKSLIQQIEGSRKSRIITYSPLLNFDFETKNILDKLVVRGYHFLVDAGTSYRLFVGYENHTWAVSGVKTENSGWANHIDSSHILNTYARDSFNNNIGAVNLTSPIDGSISTVAYNVAESAMTCDKHKTFVSTTLTEYSGVAVTACQNLSTTDFGSLVWSVAVPKFILFTNEKCLGWCSASLSSFSIENKKAVPWHIIVN